MILPTYEFQCACGVQFEKRAPLSERRQPRRCPECAELAPPVPPSTVSGHFNHDVTGPGPQNTGIAGLDANIDRVIGQSARQGREVIAARVKDKLEVMSDEGVSGDRLSKNPDGSYSVLKPEEQAVHKRALKIHEKAGEWKRTKRRPAVS